MVRSELEDQIRDYAIDEGILGKAVPHDNDLEFGYELNFPPNSPQPLKILILKIRERKALAMQLATQIAPQHIEGLKGLGANGVLLFFEALKKVLFLQNLLYQIDIQNGRYIISDTIYPDGLTEDRFYLAVRKIFNLSLYLNTLLVEMIEGKGSEGRTFDSTIPGNSMYT